MLPRAASAIFFWKSMNGVLVRAFPRMLFWVILMYYHSSTGQNQSEEKGFVTPYFSLSHCNVTSEKIDQEMYFWSRLSTAHPPVPPLWPSNWCYYDCDCFKWLSDFSSSSCLVFTFTLIRRLLRSPSLRTKATRGWSFFLLVFIAPVLTEEERFFSLHNKKAIP